MRAFFSLIAAVLVSGSTGVLMSVPQPGQPATAIAGRWSLNFQTSQFPREIGFSAGWMSGGVTGEGSTSGRGSSGGVNAWMPRPESADDAKRLEILTTDVRSPAVRLTIAVTPSAVTITDDQDHARTIHPDGKEEVLHLGDVPVGTIAKWENGGRLAVLYHVAEGRDLRVTYSNVQNVNPPQLQVDTEFVERGGPKKIVRVYDRAGAIAAPSEAIASPAAQPANAPPPPPAVAQGADVELKGLVNIGVVVEDLGRQAISCGLKQDAIEAAVTKSLTDAGLKVRRNSDEDTYIYVDILTSSLSTGVCVSRYDVFLYSHTTATLSYQRTPALVQVSLLHKGGIAGGAPAAHTDGVMRGIKENVDQFAARIRDASK